MQLSATDLELLREALKRDAERRRGLAEDLALIRPDAAGNVVQLLQTSARLGDLAEAFDPGEGELSIAVSVRLPAQVNVAGVVVDDSAPVEFETLPAAEPGVPVELVSEPARAFEAQLDHALATSQAGEVTQLFKPARPKAAQNALAPLRPEEDDGYGYDEGQGEVVGDSVVKHAYMLDGSALDELLGQGEDPIAEDAKEPDAFDKAAFGTTRDLT